MSFNLFTAPTGTDLFGIDLYINSVTNVVTNTRQNAVVRHNETNRFFIIPHSVVTRPGSVTVNFLRGNEVSESAYRIVRAELAARPTANSGDLAFSVATTVTQNGTVTSFDVTENTISIFYYTDIFATSATFSTNTVCFVVTQMSQSVLELSRVSLAAGGDGSVPLTAQISYTVSAPFLGITDKPRYLDTVVTIHTLPFSLTYQAPLSRDLTF